LHGAVFAKRAMQDRKHYIYAGIGSWLGNERARMPLPFFTDEIFNYLISGWIERALDGFCGSERNVVLPGAAAKNKRDPNAS
jgi:hypothetical protein